MRKRLAALALLILAACVKPPVSDDVTVQFSDDGNDIRITAETKFDPDRKHARVVEAARNAAIMGTDPWSVRFARVNPEHDQVTFERRHGALERVVHVVRIPADDLHRVLSDTNVTVLLTRDRGWHELTLLPGTSPRATREQQRHFEEQLASWSHDVARYFTTIDHLYDYMDDNPGRTEALFEALLSNKEEIEVTEDEVPFVTAVIESMERLAERMDATEGTSHTFAEEADLIYNPFPARMTFRVPNEKDLVIEPVDLFGAVAALEGHWISPDPLAALLKDEAPSPKQLAEMPRKSTPSADAGTIARAITEQLARPKSYSIRWRE